MKPRNRIIYLFLIVIIMGVGITSRIEAIPSPYFWKQYGGDTLWASLVYIGFATLFRSHKPLLILLYALTFAYAIEFSQFYQAPWINSIRSTKIGGLILGFGFLPSDFVCYTVGILIACGGEALYLSKQSTQ